IDPRSGKIAPATYALFAIGVATVILSAWAFKTSVDNAAYNTGRYEFETQQLKKPGYAVRPRVLSVGYDWMAFGGLAASLVCLTFGLARMRKERQSPLFRIGTAPGVEFATEGAPSPTFAMIS